MDRQDSVDQEWEIKDLLHRAKNCSDQHSNLRQEALQCLIISAHSDSPALKIIAAGNMRFFLVDCPDLEEEAVNAIYDLCEDPSSKVRLQGYHAITDVSRTLGGWIKKNADVLVQLLQSEEADEVTAVKEALVEHLDMDPKVTLGVLCDQINLCDDATDEDEKSIRERLRSLVLRFMAGEAKHIICEVHAAPGGIGESVLYEGLFAAIPRLGTEEVQFVLQDLIYALPAFKSYKPSERAAELQRLLLAEKAMPGLKEDLHSDSSTLKITQPVLQICEHLTCILQVAPAIDLLEFFCTSLIGKITLQRMKLTDQQWVICSLARVLRVVAKQPHCPRFLSLRRKIVDACPYLLEVLKKSKKLQNELQPTYGVFLEACRERANEPSWTLPPNLLNVLKELQKRPEITQNKEHEIMIRSLLPTSQPDTNALPANAAKTAPPPRTFSTPRASGVHVASFGSNLAKSVHSPGVSMVQDRTKRDVNSESSVRPTKRTKVEEVSNASQVPTLLSRLGSSTSRQFSPSNLSSRTETSTPIPEDESPPQPSRGFSIKGAATKQKNQKANLSSRVTPSTSLLERLQDPQREGFD